MKVLSVVGARPQFVKLAPVAQACDAAGVEHVIVHTGQHYDPGLSDVFFADLRIPAPDVHLAVGSGSHGEQTGAMLGPLEAVMEQHRPDWVLVYGDTNSTLAAAVAAVKIHLPLAHLEAGLRSFNRRMPEEHNRVLTDHAADLLLAPTQVAMGHLADEGLADRSVLVGDVMTDVCFRVRDAVVAAGSSPVAGVGDGPYLVSTIHRAENTDDPARLAAIVRALAALPVPVLLLAHPRLRARCEAQGLELAQGSIVVAEPLPYPQMVAAVLGSAGVVTDSGGLQKEAFLLGRACTTLRTETEWVETLEGGWNVLLPDSADLARLPEVALRGPGALPQATPYGSGDAARRVVEVLLAREGAA
ncbi:non-hydrolyzing UDP-N-acetylglucosamine 2-epimerase [Cellulomonas composti]|uniref:UDP-N-acetyl glucosamine 2-epimerase n=1 Tax=Cellulomonas composti TaxID=266130 RepID=A0A511JAZ4_9CELL|nr:UDP-N-acetylglucosamine 2-epimerase (non-hydrolyzing) [Cellulomonas composti]GEL95161.1 UDP-N-acetyl glucosamine 2-epimerase [Cellulomonas composti]